MSTRLCRSIAASPANKVGIDPASILFIIKGLFALWQMCHPEQKPTPEMVRAKIEHRKTKRGYLPGFIGRVRSDLVEAENHQGCGTMSVFEHDTLAIELLEAIRTGSNEDLQETIEQL